MPRCLIFGYHGFNNTGAEARLMVIQQEIAAAAPDMHVDVASFSPRNQRRYVSGSIVGFGIRSFMLQLWTRMPAYDVLVLSEGASFTDNLSPHLLYAYCNAALAASALGKAVVVYAVDVGELSGWHRRLARAALDRAGLLMVRAERSADNARELGLRVPVQSTADPALLLAPHPPEKRDEIWKRLGLPTRDFVAIAPKDMFCWPVRMRWIRDRSTCFRYPFHFSLDERRIALRQRFEEVLARYACRLRDELELDVVLIAMEDVDQAPCMRIRELAARDGVHVVTPDQATPRDVMTILESARLLVSSRYHALVLSLFEAVPLIAISHDARCANLMQELSLAENLLDVGAGEIREHDLWDRTVATLADAGSHRSRIHAGSRALRERAGTNARLFADWYKARFSPS